MEAEPAPRVPERLHPLAAGLLEQLRLLPGASEVVIGGGVALQHYLPYRDTRDLDAWWAAAPTAQARASIVLAMQRLATAKGGEARLRSWGETESHELSIGGRRVFSFQIARRSVQLDPPLPSAWAPITIETFRDNLGAKMGALVGRAAPRDLLDVFEVCRRGLATPDDCWAAWQAKNPAVTIEEARSRVLHHLALLEERRPLVAITAGPERVAAAAVRAFVSEQLCMARRGVP